MATDDLPSAQELAEIAEEELRLALDPHGTGAVDLHDGSRNTALVSMQVGLGLRVVRYAAERDAASRASTATGDDLDVVGRDDYGEERKPEAFATGAVRLVRGSGRPATSIPQGSHFAVPATTSTPAVVFAARVTVPVLTNETTADVPLVAVEAGEAANLDDPSGVKQILDPLPDTAWEITTPAAGTVFGGGATAENDDVYRERLLQIGTEDNDQRGTRRAVLAGALRVPGVRYVVAVEPRNGTVALFVGDANYALTTAMREAIQTALLEWRCYGVPAELRTFTVVDVNVVANVWMGRSLEHYDTAAIAATAEALLREYFASRPNPDEYWNDRIAGAIGQAHPEVQHVDVSSPAGNVTRPPDTSYAGMSTLNRYRLLPGAVRLTFLPPITV